MIEENDSPEAKLRIQWAKNGMFRILTTDGRLLDTVSREEMTPLQLSQKARDSFLKRYGVASD